MLPAPGCWTLTSCCAGWRRSWMHWGWVRRIARALTGAEQAALSATSTVMDMGRASSST